MRAFLLFAVAPGLLLAQIPRIGVVDFYGIRKVSEERIRKAAGIQEGDRLPASKGDVEDRIESVAGVVSARLEAICCTGERAILYIGIEERGAPHFEFRQPPHGAETLPDALLETYHNYLIAVEKAARSGQTRTNPEVSAYERKFTAAADENLALLSQVVRDAMDTEQRAVAAYLLGYATNKHKALEDLQYAMQDAGESVRANAMRSLATIADFADAHPSLEIRVQPTWFVEMLNSIVWSDRFRAATALVNITEKRNPQVVQELRERALNSLVEMARWKTLPHALPAFLLVGRIAGLPEKQIHDAWNRGDREMVIKRALASARRPSSLSP